MKTMNIMKDLLTTMGFAPRLRVGAMLATLALGVVLGVAGTAAGNVLFKMNGGICNSANPDPACGFKAQPQVGGTVSGPTLMTTPTASGADFTIPSNLYSFSGSFTAAIGPYPYFRGDFLRSNQGGSMMAGAWLPSAVYTIIDNETQYPFVTASPAPGKIVAKVGPNGMAGPNAFFISTYYVFTYLTPGVNQGTAQIRLSIGGPSSTNPTNGGFTYAYNVQNQTNNGRVIFLEPNIWAMTGTVTMSQPDLVNPEYFVVTGMDNRSPAGASGTIQVVSAWLAHNYNVTPLPPPLDGTGTATAYRNANAGARKTTFDFIPAPEPDQIALIGMGIVGLVGVWTMRRR